MIKLRLTYIILMMLISLSLFAERKKYNGMIYGENPYLDYYGEPQWDFYNISGDSVIIGYKRDYVTIDSFKYKKFDIVISKELADIAKNAVRYDVVEYEKPLSIRQMWGYYQYIQYDLPMKHPLIDAIAEKIETLNIAPYGFIQLIMLIEDEGKDDIIYPELQYVNTTNDYIKGISIELEVKDKNGSKIRNPYNNSMNYVFITNCDIPPYKTEYLSFEPDWKNKLKYYDLDRVNIKFKTMTIHFAKKGLVPIKEKDIKISEKHIFKAWRTQD